MARAVEAAVVDLALLGTWITGWALARETPPPQPVPGGFRVEVGWPDQRARLVFPGLDGVAEAAAAIDEPWVWLKVCRPPGEVQPILPARWSIDRVGALMDLSTNPVEPGALPAGHRVTLEDRGAVVMASVRGQADAEVATGRVALVGAHAIYDRIAVDAGHRRRGLGTVVMRALGAAAADRGVTRGLLVGTPDGRALYQALGWRFLADYTSAVIREREA